MKYALLLSTTVLLLSFTAVQGRIDGGAPATDGEYPSYVHAIEGSLCGGTLVHKDIVLTAAHCAEAFSVGTTVYIGLGDVKNKVVQQYPHPNYNTNGQMENDIMLLKLESLTPSPIVPLNLDPLIPEVDSKVDVIGFGSNSEGNFASTTVLAVQLTVQDLTMCSTILQHANTQICAGDIGKDSCQGDAGGPLFVSGSNVQVGIVSYSSGCGRPGLPGINTKVSAFIDFIEDGICDLSINPPERCAAESRFPFESPTPAPTRGCSRLICCDHNN